ncbi:trypsin-like peptidase domain-containing protein [Alphaproteobacteria bacterium]|nr:trypsin-like peptidase domain-containing protein [Alphaproteobacteria bacterium]
MDANLEDPTEPKYQVGLSQTSFALGKLKLSERYATSALRDDPDLIEAELMLAMILSHTGKKQEAEKKFLDLIKVQQTNKPLLLTYAKFLEELDLRHKAISTLEDFLTKNPNSPDILDYLGRLYWFDGQSELAIEKREAAAKLYQKNGKFVMTQSITEWVNGVKEKLMVEKKKEEEKKKKALPPKNKPKFTPNPGYGIEPFPDYYYDHPVGTGSGFIINNGKQIITNRHVIEGAFKIFVRNGFGELRYATIEKISEYDDLALLTLDEPYDPAYSLIIPENYIIKTGQNALVMGFPLTSVLGDTAPSLTQGIVSKTTGWGDNIGTFSFTSKANKGNSGGPIFSGNGELIGVTVSKLPKKDFLVNKEFIPEDVNFGIKINRVQRFIQSSEPAQNLEKLELEDLYELKLPSVVMILNILPKEKEEIIEIEDEIKKEIELCQAEYNPEKYPDVTKEQFNVFCICYINGLVEIYDNEEAKYQAKFNKPSDNYTNKEEEIIKYCASKI